MGFVIQFYIIFGTNLLTGGPAQIAIFAYFSVSKKKDIKWSRSPNGMKPSGTWFSEQTWSRGLGVYVKKSTRRARGRGRAYPPGRALHPRGPLIAPPTYFFLLYIHVPPKHPGAPWKPNSTTATFCIHKIPSRGLFRSSVGGSIYHGGLLHQHHSLSDDVWVVYLRPSGP